MSLRSKLSRLGEMAPLPPPSTAPESAAAEPREQTLEQLRAKMGELLARTPETGRAEPPPRRHSPSETTLPFLPLELDGMTLHRRHVRLPASKAVGRIPVDAARAASPDLLSLLALDPIIRDCAPSRALFLDTETTGLGGGAGTLAFLVGLAYFEDQHVILEQLFLVSPAEEPALLSYLQARVAQSSMLVTFNGKSFDWPLLRTRYVMNKLPAPTEKPHLDLLHIARRLHKKRIGSVTLKRVESEVLGLERGPDIDGAEIGPRYGHFLRTGDESALSIVVEHNAIDVLSMLALVGLYGEPLDLLAPLDLTQLAATVSRGKEHERAADIARLARQRGAGAEALRVSARIAKARGDKQQALVDFEALAGELPDDTVRLELSKLYEHFVKDHARALQLARAGTGEDHAQNQKRVARLERKLLKS